MILRQMAARRQAGPGDEESISIGERCLALLVEGAARNVPEVDSDGYQQFRTNVGKLAPHITRLKFDEDKLENTRLILQEFEGYCSRSDQALRENLAAWQGVAELLFGELLHALGAQDAAGKSLTQRVRTMKTAADVTIWRDDLEKFLRPLAEAAAQTGSASALKQHNHSKANDNASGLLGGGSAIEHVQKLLDNGAEAYVVIFQLRCMEIISQRFGVEAVQDCLMAVSAFLTAGLSGRDAIYHWSDSSLLAVLQDRPSESILTADLQRILSQNRESTIKVAGRPTVVRIPLAFDVIPIGRLRKADDLLRLSGSKSDGCR